MDRKTAEEIVEKNKSIYEEKYAENRKNQEKFFLNSLEIEQQVPGDENSYEVILYTIKEGNVIPFKLEKAISVFHRMQVEPLY